MFNELAPLLSSPPASRKKSEVWDTLFHTIDHDDDGIVNEQEMAEFLQRIGADPEMTTMILHDFCCMNPRSGRSSGFCSDQFKEFMDHLQMKEHHWMLLLWDYKFIGIILGLIGSMVLLSFSLISGQFIEIVGRALICCGMLSLTASEYERVLFHWRDIHKLLCMLDISTSTSFRIVSNSLPPSLSAMSQTSTDYVA